MSHCQEIRPFGILARNIGMAEEYNVITNFSMIKRWQMAMQALMLLWEDLQVNNGVQFLFNKSIQSRLCRETVYHFKRQRR